MLDIPRVGTHNMYPNGVAVYQDWLLDVPVDDRCALAAALYDSDIYLDPMQDIAWSIYRTAGLAHALQTITAWKE